MDTTTTPKGDVTQRAIAAFVTSDGMPEGRIVAETTTIAEREYVVLRVDGQITAVYRVRPSDKVLRRMKRWPRDSTNNRRAPPSSNSTGPTTRTVKESR